MPCSHNPQPTPTLGHSQAPTLFLLHNNNSSCILQHQLIFSTYSIIPFIFCYVLTPTLHLYIMESCFTLSPSHLHYLHPHIPILTNIAVLCFSIKSCPHVCI